VILCQHVFDFFFLIIYLQQAFTVSQVDVLEYKEDLKYYYKSGHGSELNKRMACATVNDMLTQLEYNVGPKTVAYFTHSSELQLFLVALGAVKDNEPLRADNYNRLRNRFWRTSAIAPFAANVAAIKYE
jgi:multiple inositol-polyphosphate phosphatase / 2,3-bisphosphoglycerate 3-phosphatase